MKLVKHSPVRDVVQHWFRVLSFMKRNSRSNTRADHQSSLEIVSLLSRSNAMFQPDHVAHREPKWHAQHIACIRQASLESDKVAVLVTQVGKIRSDEAVSISISHAENSRRPSASGFAAKFLVQLLNGGKCYTMFIYYHYELFICIILPSRLESTNDLELTPCRLKSTQFQVLIEILLRLPAHEHQDINDHRQ